MTTMLEKIAAAAKSLNVSVVDLTALAETYEEARTNGTPEERQQAARHILWSVGDSRGYEPGGFTISLMLAWKKADPANRARLGSAFPVYFMAYGVQYEEGNDGLAQWAGIE